MVTSGDWSLLPDVTQIFRSQTQHKGVSEPWPGDGKLIDHNICLHYDTKRTTATRANFMPYSLRHNVSHVVRSVSKLNEFVQKQDQRKIYPPISPIYTHFKGLYSLKSFTVGFWGFRTKEIH